MPTSSGYFKPPEPDNEHWTKAVDITWMDSKRVTITMALIALICFFLPWIQVSCGASKDTLSGIDLARNGHGGLWLIPILMLGVLFVGLTRTRGERREISVLVTLVAGLVSAYLMNRERLRAEDSTGLIAVRLTGWFWLGLGSTITMMLVAVFRSLKRAPKSEA